MNIGNNGLRAAQALRGNPHFDELRLALAETTLRMTEDILDRPAAERAEAAAYVRGMRDLWRALEANVTEQRPLTVGPNRDGRVPRRKADPAPAEDKSEAII